MPRPTKCRRVCGLPETDEFIPAGRHGDHGEAVILTVDEFETVRLIDNEDLSQEECGANMNIARTTVQQIYNNARKKIARALVEGLRLKIEGGSYKICDGTEGFCGCPGCRRHGQCRRREEMMKEENAE